jgi:hypothetical protein
MSANEPGLELHEWQTRWQELEPEFELDAADTLTEAVDFVEQMLNESGIGIERTGGENDELIAAYEAAREVADVIERGEHFDPGNVGLAIANLRIVYEALVEDRRG